MPTTSRKSALALAGAVAGTLTAAAVAGAVNLGLLSSDPGPSGESQVELVEPVDTTSPVSTETRSTTPDTAVEVVVEDVYDLPAGSSAPPAGTSTPGPAPTVGVVGAAGPAPVAAAEDGAGTEAEPEYEAVEVEHEDPEHEAVEVEVEGERDDD